MILLPELFDQEISRLNEYVGRRVKLVMSCAGTNDPFSGDRMATHESHQHGYIVDIPIILRSIIGVKDGERVYPTHVVGRCLGDDPRITFGVLRPAPGHEDEDFVYEIAHHSTSAYGSSRRSLYSINDNDEVLWCPIERFSLSYSTGGKSRIDISHEMYEQSLTYLKSVMGPREYESMMSLICLNESTRSIPRFAIKHLHRIIPVQPATRTNE